MNRELLTHWSEYDEAKQQVLLLATRQIRIFDPDLGRVQLENRENALFLRRFLSASRANQLQIVLKDAGPLQRTSPRLMSLLAEFSHAVQIHECPPHLAALQEFVLIVDGKHLLVRFHADHARSRAIIDDPAYCTRYMQRFDEIRGECVNLISATTLGL